MWKERLPRLCNKIFKSLVEPPVVVYVFLSWGYDHITVCAFVNVRFVLYFTKKMIISLLSVDWWIITWITKIRLCLHHHQQNRKKESSFRKRKRPPPQYLRRHPQSSCGKKGLFTGRDESQPPLLFWYVSTPSWYCSRPVPPEKRNFASSFLPGPVNTETPEKTKIHEHQ